MAFNFGSSQSSSAQGSFNFGGASSGGLFGASSGGLFGGTSTPASSASFNLFGGQAASSAGLFGATPSSQPSLFGASSGGLSFGSTTGALNFGSGGGLFGSSQPSSSPSLFGSTPTLGGFGSQSTQSVGAFGAPSSANLFGGQQPAQNQIVPAGFQAGQPDFSAQREIEAIAACYDPSNPKFRFNYLFLNVVDNPAARMRPADVDELQWRSALHKAGGPNNPDRLWPVQAKGFKDLLLRRTAQDDALKEHARRLQEAEQSARHLARRQESHLKDRIDSVRRKHMELSHKLLKIFRHIDALEGRLAMAQEYWNPKSSETVHKLAEMVKALENSMAYYSAGGLQKKVETLSAAARLKEGAAIVQPPDVDLDEASLRNIFEIVSQQAAAIESLQGVLKRNNRDLAIIHKG